ncbi:MAG TPA: PAS domain-containing protein [Stellaceae bacterium]|nr:PAS domain-containing protein [Stellaceae bacterium]
MNDRDRIVTEPIFLAEPRDPLLRRLYEYWRGLCGARPMPRRAEVDPTAIPKLLPYIVMYTRVQPRVYTIRLVGEEVVNFAGRNATGEPAGAIMPPRAAAILNEILDAVASEKTPKFRAGKAHWQPNKSYRDFEACFLPLSDDGESVDIILCGITFSDFRAPV